MNTTSDGESSSASIRGLSSSPASTVRTRSSGSHKSIALSITSGDKQEVVDSDNMGGENGEEDEAGAASEAGSRAASSSVKSRAATAAASVAESKASSRTGSAALEDDHGGSKAESEGPATQLSDAGSRAASAKRTGVNL